MQQKLQTPACTHSAGSHSPKSSSHLSKHCWVESMCTHSCSQPCMYVGVCIRVVYACSLCLFVHACVCVCVRVCVRGAHKKQLLLLVLHGESKVDRLRPPGGGRARAGPGDGAAPRRLHPPPSPLQQAPAPATAPGQAAAGPRSADRPEPFNKEPLCMQRLATCLWELPPRSAAPWTPVT